MRAKLRAPLMIEQVQKMMESDPIHGQQDYWIEFVQYWSGYIEALSDCGMITDAGKSRLQEHLQNISEDWNCESVESAEDAPVDPSELMKELTKNYPELVKPPAADTSASPTIVPDKPKTKETYSWQKSQR